MSENKPMLEIKGVHKTFNAGTINEKKALRGVDLTLNAGDFVTVIGGNGAGKSTILNLITGVFPADCGSIIIDGVDVTRLPEHKRAKYLGRVFQDPMTGTAADMQIEEKEYRQCKKQQCSNPKSQLQIAQKLDLLFNILCLPHY